MGTRGKLKPRFKVKQAKGRKVKKHATYFGRLYSSLKDSLTSLFLKMSVFHSQKKMREVEIA
jgi:hypothetical protein